MNDTPATPSPNPEPSAPSPASPVAPAPVSASVPAPAPAPINPNEPTDSEKNLAAVSYIPFLGFILAPLLSKNEFVIKNAKQSLVLSGLFLFFWLAGSFLLGLFFALLIILEIVLITFIALKAWGGVFVVLPGVNEIAGLIPPVWPFVEKKTDSTVTPAPAPATPPAIATANLPAVSLPTEPVTQPSVIPVASTTQPAPTPTAPTVEPTPPAPASAS